MDAESQQIKDLQEAFDIVQDHLVKAEQKIARMRIALSHFITWVEEDYNLDEWQDGSPGKELVREAKALCQ